MAWAEGITTYRPIEFVLYAIVLMLYRQLWCVRAADASPVQKWQGPEWIAALHRTWMLPRVNVTEKRHFIAFKAYAVGQRALLGRQPQSSSNCTAYQQV
jgi:hypothetical protein